MRWIRGHRTALALVAGGLLAGGVVGVIAGGSASQTETLTRTLRASSVTVTQAQTVTHTLTITPTTATTYAGCVTPRSPRNCAPPVDADNPPATFCDTHNCVTGFGRGRGYAVQCRDGQWSLSGGFERSCSGHGGESPYPP